MPKPSALLGSGSSFEDFAATIIQKIYRGYAVRRGIKKQVRAWGFA